VVIIRATYFDLRKLRILPTNYIYVFRTILTVNSDFSLNNINRLVFVVEPNVSHELRTII
jgi:hypothetical protein